jgi:hypothetical protein
MKKGRGCKMEEGRHCGRIVFIGALLWCVVVVVLCSLPWHVMVVCHGSVML